MTDKKNVQRPLPQQVGRQSTLLSSWVILIYRLLEYRGVDAKPMFIASGIDLSLLRDPEARVPHHLVSNKIWRSAATLIGDETFVLDTAKVIYPGMYHSLSMAMVSAPSLLTAMQYLVDYRRIFHPLSRMNLTDTSDGYRFSWGPRTPYVTPWASEAVIASLIGLCRELVSSEFAPKFVIMKRELSPRDLLVFEAFFKAPVSHGQDKNAMIFEHKALRESLLTANPRIERLCLQATREYISSLEEKEVIDTIYCKIVEGLPTQCHAEDAIAQELNISLRTLQRRLQEAGTSYEQLLQETRKELALNYMNDQRLSVQEVSYLVGFSEPGNFSRAFKRWTGTSPTHFRREIPMA